jgi:thiosulfate dehydrogenase
MDNGMTTGQWRGVIAAVVAAIGMMGLAAGLRAPASAAPAALPWSVPDMASVTDDAERRQIRRGEDLVRHTAALIGPHAPDPARHYAGNNLDCQSCHIDGGTRKFGLPLVGAWAGYPAYRARSGKIDTIADRVNDCVMRSLNGRALPADSPDLQAIIAYLKFLSTGRPPGSHVDGQGAGRMAELSRAADPVRGKAVFAAQCATCHGRDGAGQRATDGGPGYAFPPLWGPDSFNTGAGMARLTSAANFIHANMPDGTTWDKPALSVEDAWDVAAYVESHARPAKADLARDFPHRQEKPVDAPYGPYADGFSVRQHKYGPFAAIRAAAKP